jgi:hypothetical protein
VIRAATLRVATLRIAARRTTTLLGAPPTILASVLEEALEDFFGHPVSFKAFQERCLGPCLKEGYVNKG